MHCKAEFIKQVLPKLESPQRPGVYDVPAGTGEMLLREALLGSYVIRAFFDRSTSANVAPGRRSIASQLSPKSSVEAYKR